MSFWDLRARAATTAQASRRLSSRHGSSRPSRRCAPWAQMRLRHRLDLGAVIPSTCSSEPAAPVIWSRGRVKGSCWALNAPFAAIQFGLCLAAEHGIVHLTRPSSLCGSSRSKHHQRISLWRINAAVSPHTQLARQLQCETEFFDCVSRYMPWNHLTYGSSVRAKMVPGFERGLLPGSRGTDIARAPTIAWSRLPQARHTRTVGPAPLKMAAAPFLLARQQLAFSSQGSGLLRSWLFQRHHLPPSPRISSFANQLAFVMRLDYLA